MSIVSYTPVPYFSIYPPLSSVSPLNFLIFQVAKSIYVVFFTILKGWGGKILCCFFVQFVLYPFDISF